MTHRCTDCERPATVSLGTVWLCQWCKWAVQADILTRRPELRAPVGMGVPMGGDDPLGPPLLRCDQCAATWAGRPFGACWWCQERRRLDLEVQRSMELARFEDLCVRLHDGDLAALPGAIHLARRLDLNRRLAAVLATLEAA